MKLIALSLQGLPLFQKGLSLSFFASQRVSDEDKESLFAVTPSLFLNPTVGVTGINASGKTCLLKAVTFAIRLLNNEAINHIPEKTILSEASEVTILSYFFHEGFLYELRTLIASEVDALGQERFRITDEALRAKKLAKLINKKTLLIFDDSKTVLVRDNKETFLPDDTSIMISFNTREKTQLVLADMLASTNFNVPILPEAVPSEDLLLLDSSIESIEQESGMRSPKVRLKFHGKPEILCGQGDLFNVLSSGTIRGITLLFLTRQILKTGGILVLDEIENHLNRELVATLVRLFLDTEVNTQGATLLFSTHYPELLDIFKRNDSLYRVKNESGGIVVEPFSNLIQRNDIKKSVLYESGSLGGTAPKYEAYIQFKKSLKRLK